MMPDRAHIERLVPHSGAMCLLDAVTHWDAVHISCSCAEPHATHPLARGGRLPAIAACEYAAQATAVHGALLDGADGPRAGLLAKLADVELHSPRFPRGGGPLTVRAELLSRLPAGCLYAFDVASAARPIARGRLIVAFGTGAAP
jgi:predicted hotdog family 3-hydroxylacyl-ACP dehydratase